MHRMSVKNHSLGHLNGPSNSHLNLLQRQQGMSRPESRFGPIIPRRLDMLMGATRLAHLRDLP